MINYETNIEPPAEQAINELNQALSNMELYVNPVEVAYYANPNEPIEQALCDDDWGTQDIPSCSFQNGLNWLGGNDSYVEEEAVTEKPANQVIIIHNYTGEVVAERPKTTAGTGTQLTLPSGESASGIAYPIIMAACLVPMCYVIGKMVVSAIKSVMDSED